MDKVRREGVDLSNSLFGQIVKADLTAAGVDSSDIDVRADSEGDRKIAEEMARFLKRNNPGILSVDVKGNSMRSEITRDMYETLKSSGQIGIGLVRWPHIKFRLASGRHHFPLWHLFVRDKEVAVVARKLTGARVQIVFKEDGGLSLNDMASLEIARFGVGLYYTYRNMKNNILVIFMIGIVSGACAIWASKRRVARKRGTME